MSSVRALSLLVATCVTASCKDFSELRPCNPILIVATTDQQSGTVTPDECAQPFGILGDVYALNLVAHTQLLVTLDSDGFEGELLFYKGSFATPDVARNVYTVRGNGTIGAKAFVPAGSYFVVARGAGTGVGPYTITFAPTTASLCDDTYQSYTVRGADIPGVVLDTDCPGADADSRQEAFQIWMTQLETITVTIDMDKSGSVRWRRTGDAAAPDLVTVPVEANVSRSSVFQAPDHNLPFAIHVVSTPTVTGAATYTLRIR